MADVFYVSFLAPALIALIAGLVIHSFIIGVNVTDWWKGRSVTSVDHIVTSLGISRMCGQCAINILLFVTWLLSNLEPNVTLAIGTVYDFFSYANFWLTSLLSIVFCLKISNFHTRLFLYLRGVIEHRTVYFIGASGLLSAFKCLMLLTFSFIDLHSDAIYKTSMANLTMQCAYINYIYSSTAGAIIPLLFFCISSVLLFSSLYHHTAKMKMSSNLSINLETYYSVMKYISFTFIYNTMFFIGHFFGALYYYVYCVNLIWLFIILDFLPVIHSSYLIYRTPKLRSQMAKVLQYLSDFVFQRKNSETRESIEVVAL